jgi:hypothetical protein
MNGKSYPLPIRIDNDFMLVFSLTMIAQQALLGRILPWSRAISTFGHERIRAGGREKCVRRDC